MIHTLVLIYHEYMQRKYGSRRKAKKVSSTIRDAIAAPIQEVKLYGTTEDEKSKWNTSEPTGQLVYNYCR